MLPSHNFHRPTSHSRARIIKYAAVVALGVYLLLLIYFSLRASEPGQGGFSDKILHFAVYGGLTALWAAALPRSKLFSILIAVSLVGASLEIAQGVFSVNRTASLLDQLANMAGAAFMLLIWAILIITKDSLLKSKAL